MVLMSLAGWLVPRWAVERQVAARRRLTTTRWWPAGRVPNWAPIRYVATSQNERRNH
ncbi:hypothetical protein OEM_34070 [Mycobacterium intracellulare subsp. yongonense 05-1390]|nr:hypothetical protein OEM_34070 [Mycobacterium intracellulare subsp. yongonense 05-1390]ARR79013.1 hypothetical protein MOTT12_03349 [Mycobacterium intracellulare subsp. yongonense]ARR84079.1 hypothetical protein MOTT27_03258 [Mycobacterium intracellulare subsp. yongonense]